MIALEDVAKAYGLGAGDAAPPTVALADVTLAIGQGEFVCLCGPSGSGKSTLLNIIGCLARPTAGMYRLDGRAVGGLNEDQLAALRRDVFGFVFQRANLLDDASALDNVEVPAIYRGVGRRARRRRALDLLRRLGVGDQAQYAASELSGGQRQRVGICRALMNGGRVILADEPTAALDAERADEALGQLAELASQGHTVIVASHDPKVARAAARRVELLDGRVVADSGAAPADAPTSAVPPPAKGAPLAVAAAALRTGLAAIRRAPLRSALAGLSVAVGVWSVTSMLGLAAGVYGEATAVIGRLGAEMITVGQGIDMERMAPAIELTRDDVAAIASLPNVYAASVRNGPVGTVTMRRGGRQTEVGVAGWSGGTLPQWLWKEYEVAEGRHLTAADDLRKADVAVLSAPVRQQMFAPEVDPVGETVLMAGRTFTVVGVFAPHTIFNTPLYRDDRGFVDNSVWVPASVCEEWPTPGGVGNIEVRVRSPALVERTGTAIRDLLIRRHGPAAEKALVSLDGDTLRQHDAIMRNRVGVLGGLGAVGLLAGGLGIAAAMLAAVAQRRREIALRMAVGARRRDIAWQFLAESMLVGLIGALAGAALGFATGAAVETAMTPVAFAPWVVASVICGAIAVSALFGIVPARRAAAVDAAEELAAD